MSAPDFVEPVVGYRAWRLDHGLLVPWSAARAGAGSWTPGVNQALCLHAGMHPHRPPPVADCTCGLYALADPHDRRLRPEHEAVGAIVAWGDVEVHATGFRAQYAAIVALALPPQPHPEHARELREAGERYGVPLVPYHRLADAALEYGRPIAFDAIPVPVVPRRAVTIHRRPPPPLGVDGATGIALEEHLVATIERGGVRLAPTPPLAKALRDLTTATVDAGTALAAGDVFARAGGDEGFALRTPVAGVVGEGDELWLAPTSWEDDAEAISWGAAGRRFYAAQLADSKNDLDPFATLRTRWIHAHAKIRSADDVLQALRRERDRPRFASRRELDALLVDRLRIALQDDRVKQALTRLDRSVAFRLHDPEADVVLTHDGVTTKPPTEDDLILHASAETADDYFAGRIDLPAALRRRDIQSSAAPGAVLRAASVLKPLHARY